MVRRGDATTDLQVRLHDTAADAYQYIGMADAQTYRSVRDRVPLRWRLRAMPLYRRRMMQGQFMALFTSNASHIFHACTFTCHDALADQPRHHASAAWNHVQTPLQGAQTCQNLHVDCCSSQSRIVIILLRIVHLLAGVHLAPGMTRQTVR